MLKANLFIVGSPKCGSTLLAKELGKNQDIFLPRIKELNYFSKDLLLRYNSYYRTYVVNDQRSYLRMFKGAWKDKYLVDGSVSYFTFKDIPERIYDYNNAAKVIICYREPLSRALSHYKMDVRMGYVRDGFDHLVNDKNSFYYRQYIENSLFYANSKRFVETFGRQNVYFYCVSHNNDQDLSNFLGLKVNINTNEKVNQAKLARNSVGAYFLKYRNTAEFFKKYIPRSVLIYTKEILYKEDTHENKVDIQIPDEFVRVIQEDWKIFNEEYVIKQERFKY